MQRSLPRVVLIWEWFACQTSHQCTAWHGRKGKAHCMGVQRVWISSFGVKVSHSRSDNDVAVFKTAPVGQ
eukprot:632463-Amphidinium_carterae.1